MTAPDHLGSRAPLCRSDCGSLVELFRPHRTQDCPLPYPSAMAVRRTLPRLPSPWWRIRAYYYGSGIRSPLPSARSSGLFAYPKPPKRDISRTIFGARPRGFQLGSRFAGFSIHGAMPLYSVTPPLAFSLAMASSAEYDVNGRDVSGVPRRTHVAHRAMGPLRCIADAPLISGRDVTPTTVLTDASVDLPPWIGCGHSIVSILHSKLPDSPDARRLDEPAGSAGESPLGTLRRRAARLPQSCHVKTQVQFASEHTTRRFLDVENASLGPAS